MCFFRKKIILSLVLLFFVFIIAQCAVFAGDRYTPRVKKIEEIITKGKLSGKIRGYYMNRTFTNNAVQFSDVFGAWLNFDSAVWNNLSFTLTGYTSQPFINNFIQTAGAGLLNPAQQGYSVLGRAFLEAYLGKKSKARVYRQTINTPFINADDFRIAPYTYEAYTLEGAPSGKFNYMLSYVTKVKGWTMTGFQAMSDFAGYPGTGKAVALGGVNYNPGENYKLQLWGYHCYDFMNIYYFQGDAIWPVDKVTAVTLSAQAMGQNSTGREIAGRFSTGAQGVLGGVVWRDFVFNFGYTSTNDDHDIVNPWGAYQGYASLIEEDCDLAGEKAYVAGISYDFTKVGLKNISANIWHSHAYRTNSGNPLEPRQNESDFTIDYKPCDSFSLRVRFAKVVSALDMNGLNFADSRVIMNYNF